MNSKQRNILIVGCIVAGIILFSVAVSLGIIAYQYISQNSFSKQDTVIAELNQPYEHNGIKVTATYIESAVNPYAMSNNQSVIGVKFVFENVSKEEYMVNSACMKAYVDAVLATQCLYATPDNLVIGNIMPGKRIEGYYCVEATKDAKKIELNYNDDYEGKVNVTFVFDIPPVEE